MAGYTLLYNEYRELFPTFVKFAIIAAVTPVLSVPRERELSTQNMIIASKVVWVEML